MGLNYAEPLRSPMSAADPSALGYVEYFAELLDAWAPDGDPNERLFRLGAAVLDALAQGVAADRLARYFEYWLLRLQGVYPSHGACQRCGAALSTEGAWLARPDLVFVCGRCGGTDGPPDLSPGAVAFLKQVGAVAPDDLNRIELPLSAAVELERVHRALIASHLDHEPRSSRVLREMAGR